MIRIDEIYTNTFWPYVRQHIPLSRVFFCDPPGRTDPDALFNFGKDVTELHYIFFHDQEPIHLDIHKPLFDDVRRRNHDLNHDTGAVHRAVVTSEFNSEFVEQVCSQYDWRHYYYFYHGWAALDWYRGYHRTWLMPDPADREITKSFISPNRIIGGKRDHRVLLLYHLFRNGVNNAWVSCPRVCPFEQQPIDRIGAKFKHLYPDIEQVFETAPLPLNFPNEDDHPMHSCWLSLFDETAQSLAYVVTETVFFGRRNHLTEKTFKPICMQLPFVMASTAHSLEYLRRYGFKTFSNIWDESYDEETDDLKRLEKIGRLLCDLDSQSPRELAQLYRAAEPAVRHNYQHFYGGNFEQLLWKELTAMLAQMQNDFRV
jgi:hypothetical protein